MMNGQPYNAIPKLTRLYLDIYQNCNLSCIMCDVPRTSRMPDTEPFLEFFRKNAGFFTALKSVAIGHQAESMLNPNLFRIISFFKERGIRVDLVTNGSLLNHRMEELRGSYLDGLFVSVDSHIPKTLESIRRGINSQSLFESLEQISKQTKESLRVHLIFCAMRRNITHLPGVIQLASTVNARQVCFQFMVAGKRAMIAESLYFCQNLADSNMRLAQHLAEREGILLNPRFFSESKHNRGELRQCCHFPFDTLYVNGNGECFLCYFHRIGSIRTTPIEDLWYGKQATEFRESVLTDNSAHCQTCHFCETQSPAHLETFFSQHILHKIPKPLLEEMAEYEYSLEEINRILENYFEGTPVAPVYDRQYKEASRLKSLGRLEQSQELFFDLLQKELSDTPFIGGIHFHLGTIFHELGEFAKSYFHFMKCTELVPNHKMAKYYLNEQLRHRRLR